MGVLSDIVRAIYREYDRRIKRASLVTEYGLHHHGHDHSADTHAAHDGADVDREHGAHETHDHASAESEIVNVPRGRPVDQH